MELRNPFHISSRLLPAVTVGDAEIQIEATGQTRDGRTEFTYTIDLQNGKSVTGHDLHSGVGGCNIQEAFASLFSFLGAFAESQGGENHDLFPDSLRKWAQANSDEISMLAMEIEETEGLIVD